MHRRQISLVAVLIATAVLAACQRFEPPAGLDKIEHIVVIYLENRSFDNLYGLFPGANGVANAGSAAIQVDKDGKPYRTLPPPIDTHVRPHAVDPRFPADLPNAPFRIDAYVPPNEMTGSPVHRFYQQQAQINGGRMDKFVAFTDVGGLVMG
ncbi:MAG: acid phosphatase, partial [Rhodospirillales bacterium]|nr:acid phosphatase [Rhodospirillales bacterium]